MWFLRVETKEISTAFKFHALILWYSCLSRDYMPEYMFHVCFAHFEWICVFFFMYIPYSASAPALSMWLLSHVFQKLNSWFCLFCPYHSSKDSWYRCATCKHQRNANKWILVVVHMFYCSPIAVVSCMDRFCTHLFFILFVVVYVYFAYIIAHEFHLIVVHLFYINVMQIDAYFIFFNFFF